MTPIYGLWLWDELSIRWLVLFFFGQQRSSDIGVLLQRATPATFEAQGMHPPEQRWPSMWRCPVRIGRSCWAQKLGAQNEPNGVMAQRTYEISVCPPQPPQPGTYHKPVGKDALDECNTPGVVGLQARAPVRCADAAVRALWGNRCGCAGKADNGRHVDAETP
jgi:hypothetical protein